ncbi:uncharacterized protein Z520_05514 [Fonsecaea multimorphosa CBS 102226]|uniref:Benzoate 4-monooxygenase cytochrome P450 n=1 Tax=Fonsecaea multimorphosa CBS 102226 TaxID=1442371 RepID=A0A0D2KQR6_9EURO|nr:uncharacterized protein Z520_05514 [Fonsecaea multimorphosa CBS 102226]KIX99053.1 hypothetical protein Z520_05514 [Fonsecaea multimorphosa CBS 102226]OAL25317.1 hypothetical protein AYO22_05194 [Fonsecaea multimorphosa]
MPKGRFYETFWGPDDHGRVYKNVVSTENKEEHARKRKYISNAFSQKNIVTLEPVIRRRLSHLVKHLDRLVEKRTIAEGDQSRDRQVDLYKWINYLLYDTSSELTFGEALGLCDKGSAVLDALPFDGSPVYQVEGVDAFQSSGAYSAFFGPWPSLHTTLKKLTSWHWNAKKGQKYGEAVHLYLQQRLRRGQTQDFRDFVSYLLQDSQQKDRNLEYGELLAETVVIFASAIDLLASVTTNAMYHLIKNPACLHKLRVELDTSLGDALVPTYEQIAQLPYLKAVFEEALRDRPPIPQGLPRIVPEGGAIISGHFVKGGTTVSVPLFSLHHNPSIFPDPWTFRPERWLDENADTSKREYLLPFSLGPRACTGRNLAYLQIPLIIATLVRRYDFELPSPDWEMQWREPLNMNPISLPVRLVKREVGGLEGL